MINKSKKEMNKSKKGMNSDTVILILFLVVFIVLIIGVTPIYDLIFEKSQDDICRLSVIEHSAFKKVGVITTEGPEMRCPRKFVTFYNDRVVRNTEPVAVYSSQGSSQLSTSFQGLNDYVVNQVLADELYQCWLNMGKGELNVFNQNYFFLDGQDFTPERKVCMVCSQLYFKEIPSGKVFTGLESYLKTNNIKKISDSNNNTYYDFLASKTYKQYYDIGWITKNDYPSFGAYTKYDFVPDKPYYVIFRAGKITAAREFIKAGGNYYSVHVLDADTILNDKVCDYLYS